MFQGKLSVRGRVHLLEEVRDLLLDLDLDWEANWHAGSATCRP